MKSLPLLVKVSKKNGNFHPSNVPLKKSLAHAINILNWHFMNLLLDFIVNVNSFLGSTNIICKVIVIEIFSHIFQSVQ